MFCEKCGAQIPDGGDVMCANCRARFGTPQQNFAQPQYQQPVQPQYQQPVQQQYQQPASQGNFSMELITGNTMFNMVIRLFFGAFAVWASFGPLLKYIGDGLISFSFMEINSLAGMVGKEASKAVSGYFAPLLIFMILSIILSLAGIVLTLLPKLAPQVKLSLPAFAPYAATAGALLFSIVSQFITIGFTNVLDAPFTGFGIFMMVFSFISLAAIVFLALPLFKKK